MQVWTSELLLPVHAAYACACVEIEKPQDKQPIKQPQNTIIKGGKAPEKCAFLNLFVCYYSLSLGGRYKKVGTANAEYRG